MLLVDCHEPNEILNILKPNIDVKVIKLKFGDYSFSDVVIERKTLSDFFSSLKSNRLSAQMENMSRYYSENYLLVEGFFDFSYVNNIDYLYSEMFNVTLDFDVKLIFSKDEEATAGIIRKLYFRKNFGYKKAELKQDKIHCAANLFGISQKKFKILMTEFGCMKNIANANKNDFKKIKSIGKKTIEKINSTLEDNMLNQTP